MSAAQKAVPLYLRSSAIWGKRDIWQIPSTTCIAVEMLEKLSSLESIIELGCGTGKGLGVLASLGATSLIGLDVNIRATAYAQSEWNLQQPAAFIAGDATKLPFADDTFD